MAAEENRRPLNKKDDGKDGKRRSGYLPPSHLSSVHLLHISLVDANRGEGLGMINRE